MINLAQSLHDCPRIAGDGAAHSVVIDEVPGQGLNVAVENNTDHFSVLVDQRAARVAADDVGRRNGVKRSLQVERGFGPKPAFGELVRRLAAMLGGMIERSPNRRVPRHGLAVQLVTPDRTVAEAKGERGIRRYAEAALGETKLGDGSPILAQD